MVNENDNNPIFDEDVYTYFISENIPSGDVIAMVRADIMYLIVHYKIILVLLFRFMLQMKMLGHLVI